MAMDELAASLPKYYKGCLIADQTSEVQAEIRNEYQADGLVPGADDPMWLAAQGDWDAFVKQVTQ